MPQHVSDRPKLGPGPDVEILIPEHAGNLSQKDTVIAPVGVEVNGLH